MDEIVTNSGGSNGEWLEDSRKAQDGYDWRSKSCLPGGGDDHSKQKKQIIAFYVTTVSCLCTTRRKFLNFIYTPNSSILPYSTHLVSPNPIERVHVIVCHYDLSLENTLSLVPLCL